MTQNEHSGVHGRAPVPGLQDGRNDIDELLEKVDDHPSLRQPPSLVPVVIAVVYCMAMPVLVGAWLAHELAASDADFGESFARWLYAPLADLVLVAVGLATASIGYFVTPEIAVWAGAVPLTIAAVGPAVVHAFLLILTWWGVARLFQRKRTP